MWSNISKHGWQQPAVRIYGEADYADYAADISAADMKTDSIFSAASDMETDSIFFAVFTLPRKLCRGSKRRPSLSLKSRNNALQRGLVKMSAKWWLERTKRVSSARTILTAENS